MYKIGGCILTSNSSKPHYGTVSARDSKVDTFVIGNKLMSLGSKTASDIHLIPEHTPISNQGMLGSCVANSTADAFEIIKGMEDPQNVKQLSRLFLYWNARLYDKDTAKDDGTYISNAMKSLIDYGVCEETTWDYHESKVFSQPNILAYKEADDNTLKADNFYKIRSVGQARLNEIELAIRSNHPVVFGTDVDSSFLNYYGDLDKVFDAPTNSLGGHAMCIVGVRKNPNLEFYIRNSWSSSWGIAGHAWFSSNYITSPLTDDLYVPTRMPDLLK